MVPAMLRAVLRAMYRAGGSNSTVYTVRNAGESCPKWLWVSALRLQAST